MGQCIYNSHEGVCYFFEEDAVYEEGHIKNIAIEYGFTIDKGYCVVEDDECPEDTCGSYETDFRDEEDLEE